MPFLAVFLIITNLLSCKQSSTKNAFHVATINSNATANTISTKNASLKNTLTPITAVLYNAAIKSNSITVKDAARGGTFIYKRVVQNNDVDNGITFKSKYGGIWQRVAKDTVKLAWFGISAQSENSSHIIYQGIQAAINRHASVVTFPASQVFHVKTSNYWNVNDNTHLTVAGNGATIIVDKAAAIAAQETYVMAFKCAQNVNSLNSAITIKNLRIQSSDIVPQWKSKNYNDHRLVMAIEADGIHTVMISGCKLKDIYGYGIRLKNFVNATIENVQENNVGGHFPVENGFDSFGDGIWLGHYDVQTVRSSRKSSRAIIKNCTINGYSTATNGNFASRCGITVEGFNSYGKDITVNVDVTNCKISDYDRNLHVEGIGAIIKYTNCTLRNFFGIALIVKSPYTNLTYSKSTASGLLKPNADQEHYGLGGVMQFDSNVDLQLINQTIFKFNGPASFRANCHIESNSILDMGNSDVFFDHANLFVNSGGSIINIPSQVPRGYNMYGGSINFNGAKLLSYAAGSGAQGSFHGESIESTSITNCKITNTHLIFSGQFGTRTFN